MAYFAGTLKKTTMQQFIFKTAGAALLLMSAAIQGQTLYGLATYESKTSMPPIKAEGMSDEMVRQIEAMTKRQLEKTFVLQFSAFESAYSEEAKMETPQPQMEGINVRVMNSGQGKRYTNIKSGQRISEEEIFGKEFLITDSLPKWNWTLESETKKIGDYTCNKAIAVVPVTEAEKAAYRKQKDELSQNPNRIVMLEEPQDYKVTVWYSRDIPVGHGPSEFWGLPGLILEANDGRTTLLCSKLVLNPKEQPKISKPKTGQKVTQKEFEDIRRKKMQEIEKMDLGRGQNDGMRIRIGG